MGVSPNRLVKTLPLSVTISLGSPWHSSDCAKTSRPPGHWKGDLIFGKRLTCVGTLVERSTRYVMLFALPDGHRAELVRNAMAKKIRSLPTELRRSITWDQGPEMSQHAKFTIDTGIQIYFCDPRSPWQRGSSENTNGLLRQYLPKTTDLSTVTRTSSTPSLDLSTVALDKRSAGSHHLKHSTRLLR